MFRGASIIVSFSIKLKEAMHIRTQMQPRSQCLFQPKRAEILGTRLTLMIITALADETSSQSVLLKTTLTRTITQQNVFQLRVE